jgi:putative peptidoglycan lipid II flippase
MKRISSILVLLMLANALASYLREMIVAARFGATAATDAYFSAYVVATAASDLMLGAALLTSCVPVFAPLAQAGQRTLRERAELVTTGICILAVAGTLIALLLWATAPGLIDAVGPGLSATARATATRMLGIMVWLIPVNGLLAFFVGVLNAHGRFIPAALAASAINVTFILSMTILSPTLGAFALPVAALLGPAMTVIILALYLGRMALLQRVPLAFDAPAVRLLLRLAAPTLLTLGLGTSAGLLTISQLLLRSFGSHRGEGAISALAYGFRIYEVPITLVANTAGAILLPTIAGLHARGDNKRIADVCRSAFVWGPLLLLPAVMATALEPDLLVHLLLGYGRITAAEVSLTGEALRGFAPTILFEAICFFMFQVFYAIHRPQTPLALSLISIAITLALLTATQAVAGLTVISACLGASFAVTCLGGGAIIFRAFGRGALPETARVLALVVSAGLGFAVWQALGRTSADHTFQQAFSLVAALGAYFLGVLVLLPEERRLLAALLKHGKTPPDH